MGIMALARQANGIFYLLPCLLVFTLFSAFYAPAKTWETQAAAQAFEEAEQKRGELARNPDSLINQYRQCALTYRKVYLHDPHYSRAGEAIYQEGLLYQEMGEKFSDPRSYATAARRFEFLARDYPSNSNSADALLRAGNIYLNNLNNEEAARNAFLHLKTVYGRPGALARLEQSRPAQKPSPPPAEPPVPAQSSAAATSVRNIRYWITDEYTRVVIDMDADTSYEKARLYSPYRIYFDISNATIAGGARSRTFSVEDELVRQVRVSQNRPDLVRVVLDLAAEGTYSAFELHDPFRIVVDLYHKSGVKAAMKHSPLESAPRADELGPKPLSKQAAVAVQAAGKIPEIRPGAAAKKDFSPPAPADTRIKSEAKKPEAPVSTAAVKGPPPPAVVELEPAPAGNQPKPAAAKEAKAAGVETAGPGTKPPPAVKPDMPAVPKAAPPTSRGDRTLTRVLGLKVGRIVIDPGHGGHDLGSVGPGGLMEKDLVLAVALNLKTMLEESLGAEVFLTRTDDSFVSLEERTAIANRNKADLFISIHANSSRIRSTSGVETYYLDFAKTNAEREIAARENATSVNNVHELEDLIKKIVQADKSMESRELATIIQKRLFAGVKKIFSSAQDRGVRRAPFIVLIGANMPSVLSEIAFISNPRDERLLRKDATKERLTRALYSGIEDYISTLGTNVVQNQPSPE